MQFYSLFYNLLSRLILLLSLQYLLSLVYALGSKQHNETLKAETNVNLRPHSTYRVNQAAHPHRSQHRLTAERPPTSWRSGTFYLSRHILSEVFYIIILILLYYIFLSIFRYILTTNFVT